jgi:hypothetical protein
MSEPERASVLIVDDEPDERFPFAESLRACLGVEVAHPGDVTPEQITAADLVLVDYVLDNWPERDQHDLAVALCPLNGVALSGVLRAHAEADRKQPSPAFALLSGHLHDLSPDFPHEHRHHILAQSLNLEWVFPKGNLEQTIPQITALAEAMKILPRAWKHEDHGATLSQLRDLLKLNEDLPGCQLALEDVEKSHPPIHELSETSHGLSIVRWLLHRILPYPTFLLDSVYLAARLRIEPVALQQSLADGTFRSILEEVEYSGILASFLGPRWWRSGIESWIWEVTDGQPHRPEYIHQALEARGAPHLEPVPSDREIVCMGINYQPDLKLYRMDEAVRVQPDDWPPYADQAWASIEAARDIPGLRALVIQDDAELLT